MPPKFAQTPNDLMSMQEMLSMSGLQFMQQILDGVSPAPPISQTLNFNLTEVGDGHVVFVGQPQFEHCNPMGTLHGGWYGTILDSCMACAVMTKLAAGTGYTTLEYKVNIVKGVPLDEPVRAVGRVQHMGRSTGVAIGELRGVADDRLYATGSTTCIVLRP